MFPNINVKHRERERERERDQEYFIINTEKLDCFINPEINHFK
jgi:hypothetical protein